MSSNNISATENGVKVITIEVYIGNNHNNIKFQKIVENSKNILKIVNTVDSKKKKKKI